VVRDLAVAAHALRARGIELDVLLLEAVAGYESYVCMTHLRGQRPFWLNSTVIPDVWIGGPSRGAVRATTTPTAPAVSSSRAREECFGVFAVEE
jgi:hypothetical protein